MQFMNYMVRGIQFCSGSDYITSAICKGVELGVEIMRAVFLGICNSSLFGKVA